MTIDEWRRLLLTVAPVYLLFVALIYNGTYWQAFGVNILQFASPGDIVAMAVFPVTRTFVLLALGAAVGTLAVALKGRFGRSTGLAILAVWILLLLAVGIPQAVAFLSGAIGILAAFRRIDFEHVSAQLTGGALMFLVLLPFEAYLRASYNADLILNDKTYMYSHWDGQRVRFVGYAGGSAFLLSEYSETLVIRQLDSIGSLELHYYPEFPDEQVPTEWLTEFWNNL
jgi:hypothetical protein